MRTSEIQDAAGASRLSRILVSHGRRRALTAAFSFGCWSAPPYTVAAHRGLAGATLTVAPDGTAGDGAGIGCVGTPYQRE